MKYIQKLKAKLPEFSSIDDERWSKLTQTPESSEGYSFIHTDKRGNRYHPDVIIFNSKSR